MRSLGSGAGSGLNQRPVAYRIEGRYLGARHGPEAPWRVDGARPHKGCRPTPISIAFSPMKPPPAASSEIRFEVVVLSARQAPVEHARRRVADVLEAVHHVARDEDDGARAGRRGLVPDGQLMGALEDEEYFFLVEMNVVGGPSVTMSMSW